MISALTFVYDGWNLIAELDLTGRALRTHLWGLDLSGSQQGAGGVGGLLATATPERAVFLSYDANGNLTGELDATTGLTTYTATFDAFGNVLTSERESLTPFGIQHQVHGFGDGAALLRLQVLRPRTWQVAKPGSHCGTWWPEPVRVRGE